MNSDRTLIVVGFGYLGAAVKTACDAHAGPYRRLVATVRSHERQARLQEQGVEAVRFDLNDWRTEDLAQLTAAQPVDLVFMVPPSGIDVPERQIARLAAACAGAGVRRALLISSTGVYGRPQSIDVDAASEPRPDDRRSERLLRIEHAWQAGGSDFVVLRLAGLYGPGRIIGRTALAAGRSVGGDPHGWLNLIQVDDAAALALCCLARQQQPVELGADGSPVRRVDYYRFLAELIDAPTVSFDGAASRNTASKRCRPQTTFKRLDWRPRFNDYRAGLRHALAHDQQ